MSFYCSVKFFMIMTLHSSLMTHLGLLGYLRHLSLNPAYIFFFLAPHIVTFSVFTKFSLQNFTMNKWFSFLKSHFIWFSLPKLHFLSSITFSSLVAFKISIHSPWFPLVQQLSKQYVKTSIKMGSNIKVKAKRGPKRHYIFFSTDKRTKRKTQGTLISPNSLYPYICLGLC